MFADTPGTSSNTCQRCGLVSTSIPGRLTLRGWLGPFCSSITSTATVATVANNCLENLKLVRPRCHVKSMGKIGEILERRRNASEFSDANKQRRTWGDPAN